jgi:hypothetical protein
MNTTHDPTPTPPPTVNYPALEAIGAELLTAYAFTTTPIPIEAMLQYPKPGMWTEIDISQISLSFFNAQEPYAPRMSLARLLARHIAESAWGQERAFTTLGPKPQLHAVFARIVTMPRSMVYAISESARTPALLRQRFEVPLAEATQRLSELAQYAR